MFAFSTLLSIIFKAEVANFISIDVKTLKRKFVREIRKPYRLVKKDYEILYQKFIFDAKTYRNLL